MKFPGRNAVAVAGNQPHGREPLVQTQGRIFHDSSGLQGKLPPGVTTGTLPAVVLGLELHLIASAGWAGYAVGPATGNDVTAAVLGVLSVNYRFLESGGFGCHDYTVP